MLRLRRSTFRFGALPCPRRNISRARQLTAPPAQLRRLTAGACRSTSRYSAEGVGAFSPAHKAPADRRNRENDGDRNPNSFKYEIKSKDFQARTRSRDAQCATECNLFGVFLDRLLARK